VNKPINIALLCLAIFAQVLTYGQVMLTGKVQKPNGDALVNAQVGFVGGTDLVFTNQKGEFTLSITDNKDVQLILAAFYLGYQSKTDTIKDPTKFLNIVLQPLQQELKEVIIQQEQDAILDRMRSIRGTYMYAAKKNELIAMDGILGNKATNNPRQIYGTIAGVNIWESDAAGIQLDIGGRGLSPSRTANFNTRQNGYDISADALGYPESYYTPQANLIQKIDIIRGASSLQFGTQFGGTLNFMLKDGGTEKLHVESKQTVGSFGLFNTFNAIGINKGKSGIYAMYSYKAGSGASPNSDYAVNNAYVALKHRFSDKFNIKLEYTYFTYLAQQAGGLTDAQFEQDAYQSTRSRNWFQVNWNLPALRLNWRPKQNVEISTNIFALIADRQALGYQAAPNQVDPGTQPQFTAFEKQRGLIYDDFQNIGAEVRSIWRNYLFGKQNAVATGIRLYRGFSDKKQGFADSGSEANFRFNEPTNPGVSSFEFINQNTAFYLEDNYKLNDKIAITPGARVEYINTNSEGSFRFIQRAQNDEILIDTNYAESRSLPRSVLILGLGASYKLNPSLEFYSNISQNYRSVTYNDFRVVNPTLQVDTNLVDETGYNFDIGFRGKVLSVFTADVSGFVLRYNNRIGSIIPKGRSYLYRTNIGASTTVGIESLIKTSLKSITGDKDRTFNAELFVNFSALQGQYTKSKELAIVGNSIELVPNITVRTGLNLKYKNLSLALNYSYVGKQFSDATNTEYTVTGISGIIPAYQVWDLSAAYQYKNFTLETGVNNLFNAKYFTRRATGYPGPGIISALPINGYFTLGYRLH